MTPMTARPIDVPNWARVLKIAPASDWSRSGNTSEMTKMPTVNNTMNAEDQNVLWVAMRWLENHTIDTEIR